MASSEKSAMNGTDGASSVSGFQHQQSAMNGTDGASCVIDFQHQQSAMNGTDGGSSVSGFRHQLPQIPLMTKNSKIAQSKSSAKDDASNSDHSTTNVEGSETMEVVYDSPEKLLDQIENYQERSSIHVTTAEIACNTESVVTENNIANNGNTVMINTQVEERMDVTDNDATSSSVQVNVSASDVLMNKKAEGTSMATVDASPVKSKSLADNASKINSPVTDAAANNSNTESVVVTPVNDSTNKSPNITAAAGNSTLRANRVRTPRLKEKQAAETSGQSDTSLLEDLSVASLSKRQRKPKKFEDDEKQTKTVVKSPTVDKPDKSKLLAEKELESKFPGSRDYHVQFFGDSPERAWINLNNLLEFKGQKDFNEYVAAIFKTAKSSSELRRLKKLYNVSANRAKAVNVGIFQAEIALPLTHAERKASYTFTYDVSHGQKDKGLDSTLDKQEKNLKIIKGIDNDHQKCIHAKKRKHEEISTPDVSKTAAKRRKIETSKIETLAKSLPPTTPTARSPKKTLGSVTRSPLGTEGSFEVFCQKEKENVTAEHREFSDTMLIDYCRQQWCMMSKKQKARYRSKYTEGPAAHDSSNEMSPTRNRKKSKKMIEAEADNKIIDEVLSPKKSETPESLKTVRRSRSSVAVAVTEEKTPVKELKMDEKRKMGSPSGLVEDACVKEEAAWNRFGKPESLHQNENSKPSEDTVHMDKKRKRGRPKGLVEDACVKEEAAGNRTMKPESLCQKEDSKPNKDTVHTDEKRKRGRPSRSVGDACVKEEAAGNRTGILESLHQNEDSKPSEDTVHMDEKRKRGRPSGLVEEACIKAEPAGNRTGKPELLHQNEDSKPCEDAVHCDTIPAKRAKPRKSSSTESQSDKQHESGQSTPSSIVEAILPPKQEQEEYEYQMEIYKLSSAGPQKKENLCQICEQTGELLECLGPCQGFFHMDCLGLSTKPEGDFKCDECTNGMISCFICKKSDVDTLRCTVPVCRKFYHLECVKQHPQARVEGKSITCPLHFCHTCIANNLKGSAKSNNGRLLRCVRCPTAYHVGDFCISAGSINLTGFNIVCAKHFQPISSIKHHSHVNVGWCFSCNKGGTLLCCESCPAAYHAECLNIEFPTGSWYCPDCVKGKRPLYGEIIWIKLGNYRWWPGEICHPRNVPVNIQEKTHQVGEFPAHFLGSHEYFWLHQGRVFSFQDGDKGSKFSSNKGLTKCFMKGLHEAQEAYKVWKEFRNNQEQLELARENKKPAPFRLVKTNIPLGNVTIKKADLSDLPRCECKPDQENPCGRDSECLNAMMMYECHPALCPAGEKCQNQFFTKRQYPSQQPYKTEGRGWGLKAMEDIKKGHFVNEYVGDLIDEEECKKRLEKAHEDDISNFYMMTLDMDRIIDAGPKGNMSRFMNHSCDPNLETQKWNINGDVRVGLFALKNIQKGEELTFNYNFDCLGNEQTKCQCGAHNCSGYLGVRPKAQYTTAEKKDSKLTKLKKKKKVLVKRKHDDDCFRCGEGGELVMCDRSTCPKSYHLTCLQLNKPPHGKWDCPWHHCDECGKPAVKKCIECPNSYCATHAQKNVKQFDDKVYCQEHKDLLKTLIESQSQNLAASGENCTDATSDHGNGVNIGKPVQIAKNMKEADLGSQKTDSETLPPKKRASKSQLDGKKDKNINDGPSSKGLKGRRGSKGDMGSKGSVTDDPLAVAPMFDDEEEGFDLVIDIPNF